MIAEALVEVAVADGHDVIFIGSTKGQDQKYFAKHSAFSSVYFLETSGVVDKKGFGKIKSLLYILKAFFISRKILKKHKIQATYSVGGFSAAPTSLATLSRFIPLYIHEQNAVTGRLNSLLRPYAKRFISAYEKNSIVKGYPVKDIFYKNARVRNQLKIIIFLGGSHGAKAINDLALSVAKELTAMGIKIIHQAGEKDFQRVENSYHDLGIDVELYSFTKDIPALMSKADLAISRAGASTLWELTSNGLPALYIPYPYAAGDHQYYNAKFIVDNEMGWCEREEKDLKTKLLNILDADLNRRSKKLLSYVQNDVAYKMIQDIKENI